MEAKDANDSRVEFIPIVTESLIIEKREVETGKVKVNLIVREHPERVEEHLFREEVDIVHVPINQFVDEPATVREEGDTTIVPVFEERVVVTKRIFLKEEIHLTKRRIEDKFVDDVSLRKTEVQVQRIESPVQKG